MHERSYKCVADGSKRERALQKWDSGAGSEGRRRSGCAWGGGAARRKRASEVGGEPVLLYLGGCLAGALHGA